SDWSADCNEYGACCLSQGKCIENVLEEDCVLNGGVYGGHGTDCTAIECVAAACCIESTCSQLTESACIDAEGYFFEAESCGAFDCSSLSNGDECSNAINVTEGQFSFNTNYMTPSTPFPDDKICASTNLNWGESADVWFVFTPVTNGYYRISTCDQESYDTSMVLYEGNCSTQIACNGDSEIEGDEEGCQLYYSSIQHELLPQSEYYIRVGGWKGATGAGALTISLVPDPLPGACCFETGSCIDTLIISECQNFGGVFQGEESVCSDGVCHVITSDECETAEQVFIGASSFDTEQSTPSEPFPDELACTDEFLNWGKSPDVWMYWIATYDGIVNFSTCDIDSFDTSLVVYESNCLNQIACNGDGYPNADCQTYYSSINVEVSLGETYYIRIGGWQGTIGEGKLIIDDSPTKKVGACCVEDSCLDSLPDVSCLNSGGTWYSSMECDSVTCDESTLCEDAFLTQFPMPGSEDWFAGTSASDAIQGIDYKRSEFIDVESISTLRVFGIQLRFDAKEYEWYTCDADFTFNVRNYADDEGLPGDLIEEHLDIYATKIETGILYGGVYELIQWEIELPLVNVEHLSVQSASEGLDCWFLWMNSSDGDSTSSRFSNGKWNAEPYDLSICVDE
ncbi:MAG: hypothetical protein MK073_06125, partial [Phycisphaerales bacterium]|nr:hypothetical protein [Phycisphaerales bacterium]